MRFDLTHAAFRVLDRASEERLPMVLSTDISPVKLLVALFKEEDCRAAQWLFESGMTLAGFRESFDLDILERKNFNPALHDFNLNNASDRLAPEDTNGTNVIDTGAVDSVTGEQFATLQMPVSAPSFQAGSYGIPAEAYSGTAGWQPNTVNPVGTSNGVNATTNVTVPLDADGSSGNQYQQQKKSHGRENEHDEVTLENNKIATPTSKRYYSIFAQNSDNNFPVNKFANQRNLFWFYVDDQPVTVGQLSRELETAFETIGLQFGTLTKKNQKIPIANGGVRTIETTRDNFSLPMPQMATEHLLLAISMDVSDVGLWLSDHGLDTTTLRERITALHANSNLSFVSSIWQQSNDAAFAVADLSDSFASDSAFTQTNSPHNSSQQTPIDNSQPAPKQLSYKIYRLLDAATNRSREAIRVLEDFARFVLDDAQLTKKLKSFRHRLQTILNPINLEKRLEARESGNDVGKEIEGENEYFRGSTDDVIDANFARLQESLRSIEEFSKINYPEIAREVERLRYESYSFHKEILCHCSDRQQSNYCNNNYAAGDDNNILLKDEFVALDNIDKSIADADKEYSRLIAQINEAKLCVLVDCMESEFRFGSVICAVIEGGADVIQLRDKVADDRRILACSRILREQIDAAERDVLFIMNDRTDLAKISGADGVHLGQDDLSIADARRILGKNKLIGISTHNIDQARQAVTDGSNYIGAGPVFISKTKSFDSLAGTDFLREINKEITIPAFAIGGIDENNINEVITTGISRIAVSSTIQNAQNPKITTENLRKYLTTSKIKN
ncbi:MAG: thiamine phosphate synthase [Planctomycetaceae bacterium]|jgi:thiamine-phosphate pyrophosphorylase|nr:thiamine phosphate synthase [Planctomycetaceae bacterium]